MLKKLPEFIDPLNAVDHDKHLVGTVKQSEFKRLQEVVESSDRDVEVDIQFYFNKRAKLPAAKLKTKTVMNLSCQRSLEQFDYPVSTEMEAVFLETLALADDVPDDLEIYELQEGEERVSLFDWIEDELLLAIPMVPMKPESSMPEFNSANGTSAVKQEVVDEKPNPFAALKDLKFNK